MKNFIWYFYTPQQLNHPKLIYSQITRMFYLATYMDYNNYLRLNRRTYLTTQEDFQNILQVQKPTVIRLKQALKNNMILFQDNQYFYMNSDIFYKGVIKKKTQLLYNKKCVKINSNEIRFLYEHCKYSRQHKLLGYVFNLIPYCSMDKNIIMTSKQPATWFDIFKVLNYRNRETKTMIHNLSSLKLSNGEPIFIQNNNIQFNTNFISNVKNETDMQIDLYSIQEMIDKIRNNNTNENNFIYLINMVGTNYYKIGCTSDINKRLYCLQTSSPVNLKLTHSFYGGYKIEYYLHKIFSSYKIKNEWFDLPDNYVNIFKQIH